MAMLYEYVSLFLTKFGASVCVAGSTTSNSYDYKTPGMLMNSYINSAKLFVRNILYRRTSFTD
jgi:hypothetical protein